MCDEWEEKWEVLWERRGKDSGEACWMECGVPGEGGVQKSEENERSEVNKQVEKNEGLGEND